MSSASILSDTVLDALPTHIAVLDHTGLIVAVNQAWRNFAAANGADAKCTGVGVNYLDVCQNVQDDAVTAAHAACTGIGAVLSGTQARFTLEYPCHSPTEERWFLLEVVPLCKPAHTAEGYVVVAHHNITDRRQAEDAVAREHNLLRRVIDSLPDFIFLKDREGHYVLINEAYREFLGATSPEAVTGKTVFDLYPPELAEKYHADDLAVLNRGESLTNYEELSIDHGGNHQFHLATKRPLYDDQGAIVGIVGVGHDITQRRRMEQELAARESFIRQVIDTSPHLIFVKDRQGNFLLVNQAVADAYGMSKEQMLYRHNTAVHPQPHEVAHYLQVDQQVIETQETISVEEPFTDADGQTRWYHTIKTPLIQEDGTVTVLGIATDITEQRQMVETLRQSEARQRALLEAIPDAIARLDRAGRYLDIKAPTNFRSVRPVEELLGQRQVDVLAPALAQQFAHYMEAAFATGEPQVFEYELLVNRQMHVREARLVAISQDEVIAILRDITERKQIEADKARLLAETIAQRTQLRALSGRLAESREAQGKQIARELHDQVGQNLTALGLALKLVKEQIPSTVPNHTQLQAQLQDALTLVGQTTAAIRNVMAELRPPVLDDYGLFAALRWYGEQIATRSGLQVDIHGEALQPRLTEQVENALFRIAQEAMNNILKHGQATQATVTLNATTDRVRMVVRDNGRGFDPHALTETHAGWGLLNMRERAEAVGGRCHVISRPGDGTTVLVEVAR
ncbi:MAG: PAS domain-containing protein [Caldilineaceae bacterium]